MSSQAISLVCLNDEQRYDAMCYDAMRHYDVLNFQALCDVSDDAMR